MPHRLRPGRAVHPLQKLRHHGGNGRHRAFSDGNYVISTEYGDWLPDLLPRELMPDYIEQADRILVSHGATERRTPTTELKKLCFPYGLHMQQAQLKHLGTDSNFVTMVRLVNTLEERCQILTNTRVTDIDVSTYLVTMKCPDGTRTTRPRPGHLHPAHPERRPRGPEPLYAQTPTG
jgi:uncharacterized FAD-dependent dehydrogenase